MVNLDMITEELQDWLESLYVEEDGRGGYRMGPNGQVNLLSTTDAAWLRYAFKDLDSLSDERRTAWVRWIRDRQDRNDGHYAYTDAVGEGNMHSNGHAFWHANRALGILGSEISVFPEYLRLAMSVDGLREWFHLWESQPNPTHHDVLGLAPLLANTSNTDWVDCYYDEIARQQDPDTGTWPKGASKPNISRTYAYTVLFRAADRMPPQPEKIVDAMLALQSEDGFWRERNHSYFSTMDAIYILVRLPERIGHRRGEAESALAKALGGVASLYETDKGSLMENTHSMLAIVHALGLLCEAFPEEFRYSTAWRHDWENRSLFRCSLLQDAISG